MTPAGRATWRRRAGLAVLLPSIVASFSVGWGSSTSSAATAKRTATPTLSPTSKATPAATSRPRLTATSSRVPPPPGTPAHPGNGPWIGPYVCLMVVDAARYDEFDLAKMPNLSKLVASGSVYRNAWVGQLPSVTEGSHATIGTGDLPNHHTVLGDTWRVPGTDRMSPNLLDSNLTRTGYIGQAIRQSGATTLAGLVHQRSSTATVVSISAHKIYAADAMGGGEADFVAFGGKDARGHFVPSAIPGHVPDQKILTSPQLDLSTYPRAPGVEDAWAGTLALKFLFRYRPAVMMVNFPEVDTAGHAAGTDAGVIGPLIGDIDRQIGRLVAGYGRAGLLPKTTFVVTADHGMVPALHTVNVTAIQNIIRSAGGDPLYTLHGDSAGVYLKDPTKIPQVSAALVAAAIPHVAAIYAKSPAGVYRLVSPLSWLADPAVTAAYSELLKSMDAPESADIMLFYDENTMTQTPLFIQTKRQGDHGGATWGAQHIPLIVSGQGIKSRYVSTYPARLADLAPTVETLLGITPRNQDGVPLADAMKAPPAWATHSQAAVTPRLRADVQSLVAEAALRPNLR